jgi:hypothetical protein
MAFCSSCGAKLSDAARFCSNCGVASVTTTVSANPAAESPRSEHLLYQDASGGLVSTTRAVLGGVTYPVSSVSSVRVLTVGKSCWGPWLLVIGLFAAISGYGEKSDGLLVFGVIALVAGAAIVFGKPEYAIALTTAGGEKTALKSKDRAAIDAIAEALNQAVIDRG